MHLQSSWLETHQSDPGNGQLTYQPIGPTRISPTPIAQITANYWYVYVSRNRLRLCELFT